MDMNTSIGKSVQRKDAWDKVTGKAKCTDDFSTVGILNARLLTSTCAHARILNIDVSGALGVSGVKTVLTGADCPELFGPLVLDRPALARDVVRYAGEPVAIVVAIDEPTAEKGNTIHKDRLRATSFRHDPFGGGFSGRGCACSRAGQQL